MHRPIKSFVLRAGRMSPRQQMALAEGLPAYALPAPGELWHLPTIFSNNADVVVEIGFGMGNSLIAMAKREPELNFIGIEVHRPGIGSLIAALQAEGLTNVRVAPYDAVEVFQSCLADDVLTGVQVYFPDPWPKKRHHKRRLLQPDFVRLMVKKIKPGGFLHCATDWEDYAQEMLVVLSAEQQLRNSQATGGFTPRPERRPLTKFEQRGQRLGHGVWDLLFCKQA